MAPGRSSLRRLAALAALLLATASRGGLGAEVAEAGTEPSPPPPPVETTSLSEAVARALVRNPSAQVASLEIRRFEALAEEARAGWLPTIAGSASYTRLDGNRLARQTGTLYAGQDQAVGALTVTAPLLAAPALVRWRHSKDDIETARWSAAETRRQLALAVGRAWLSLVAQHRVIEISERAEQTARSHFDFAHQQFAGGYGNRIDEVRAEQEVQTDRTQVEQAKAQLARLREALGVLLGAPHPVDAADVVDLPSPPTVEQATNEARRERADVRLAEQRVRATARVVRDHWADFAPQLVALFSPFVQGQSDTPNTVPYSGWQGVLQLSLPLYDGGLRYGQQRERRALADEAAVNLEGTLRQAASDVRAAAAEMERATLALRSAGRAAHLAREGVTLTDLAYRAGASTNIEVIDAERRARDADTQVALAEDAQRQALLDLLIASGRFPAPR